MEKREPLIFREQDYVLRESVIQSDGDVAWTITDPNTQNYFTVFSNSRGEIYISFYKCFFIPSRCSVKALKKLCSILIQRGLSPTINIYPGNRALIELCQNVGFRRSKKINHLYHLKKKYYVQQSS